MLPRLYDRLIAFRTRGVVGWLLALDPASLFALTFAIQMILLATLFLFFDVRLGTHEYREIARNLASGHGFVLHPDDPPILWRPPLYIFFLAALYAVFGEHHLIVVLVQALLAATTCVVVDRIGTRIFGEAVGRLSAVLVALHPLVWYNAGRVMTETVFALLLSLVVLLLTEVFERTSWRIPLALGLATGLASLCRGSFQFFPLAVLGVGLLPLDFPISATLRLRNALIATAVMVLVILPWSVRNFVVSGGYPTLIDTSGGYTLWVGNSQLTDGEDDDGMTEEKREEMKRALARVLGVDPSAPEVASGKVLDRAWSAPGNSRLVHEALQEIWEHPLGAARLATKKLFRFWFSLYREENRRLQPLVVGLQLLVLVPALAGAVLAARRGFPVFAIFLVSGYLMAVHMAATANVRYSVPLLPYAIMLGVYAVRSVTRQGSRG